MPATGFCFNGQVAVTYLGRLNWLINEWMGKRMHSLIVYYMYLYMSTLRPCTCLSPDLPFMPCLAWLLNNHYSFMPCLAWLLNNQYIPHWLLKNLTGCNRNISMMFVVDILMYLNKVNKFSYDGFVVNPVYWIFK